jgi:hypothetical protein
VAESWFPFDAGAGANVLEDQWSLMAQHWLGAGVIKNDALGELAAQATQAIAAADAVNPRIDRVVIRLDKVANTATRIVLQGVPAASPVPIAPTRTAVTWDLLLAQVRVNVGDVVVIAGRVTDERVYATSETDRLDFSPPGAGQVPDTFVKRPAAGGLIVTATPVGAVEWATQVSAGQTADHYNALASDGVTKLFKIAVAGNTVVSPNATNVTPIVVNAAAGQTSTLLSLQVNAVEKTRCLNDGSLQALGTDHYIGPYAFGTGVSVTRLHLSQANATTQQISAEGDGANIQLTLTAKGSSPVVVSTAGGLTVQGNATGTSPFYINAASGTSTNLLTIDLNGAARTRVTNLGQFQTLSSGYFGAGVYGGAAGFTQVGDDGAGNAIVQSGHGTLANAGLYFQLKGTGVFAWRDGAASQLAGLSNVGSFQAKGQTHIFGQGIYGAAQAYLMIGDDNGGSAILYAQHGTLANAQIVYNTKGGGSHVFQTGNTTQATLTATGVMSVYGQDHYFGVNASGAVGGRVHLVGPAGTGGRYGKLAAESDNSVADLYLAGGVSGGSMYFQLNNANVGTFNSAGFAANGGDHYFGPYAFATGTSVSRLHLAFDAGAAYMSAEGDGANRDLIYQIKGTGTHRFRRTDGTLLATIDTNGIIQAVGTDHYFGSYAFGTGTSVSRLRVSTVSTGITLQSEGDGANRDLALMLKGTGSLYLQQPGPTNLLQVDSGANMTVKGTTNKFGQGAFGAAQAYTQVGDSNGGTLGDAVIAAAHGTVAQASLLLRPLGTSTSHSKVALQTASGTDIIAAGMATGPAQAIAFFNAVLAPKQTVTGSRAGNAALASLLTILSNNSGSGYGLLIDSSTA